MAYQPTLEDTPSIGGYVPNLDDTPEVNIEPKELSDHLVKQIATTSPAFNKEKINSYNEKLFTPMISTPTSSLQTGGYETHKTPLGAVYLESLGAVPFGLGEGIGAIGSRLAARNAPAFVQKLADILGMVGKNTAFGAGLEGIEGNKEIPLEERLKHGAEMGAALGAAGKSIGSFVENLRPSKFLRGNLSPEELANNLRITEGTNTGLGRVIDSPSLNRLQENILPHVIGSGAEKTMQETAKQISNKANDLFQQTQANINPGDYGFKLKEVLKKAANQARKEKKSGFDELNNIADREGVVIGRENFRQQANDILKDIEQSPELKAEFSEGLLSSIKNYASNKEGNNLKLTNIFRGKLGDKANEFYQEGKTYEHGLLKSLKDSLSKDIEEGIESSSSNDLKSLYDKNQKNYQENFAPFEDPDIVKFTRKGGDPDLLLSHFLRGGKNDRAVLLSKLTNALSEEDKNLPLAAYLQRSVNDAGEVDPIKLSSLHKNLGKNQKKALFKDDNLRQSFDDFSTLVAKNKEPFNLMFNPKTGARNTDLLFKIAQMLGGTAAGGLPGLAATLAGSALAGRGANKLLTSPNFREKLVQSMIRDGKLPGGNYLMGLSQLITGDREQNKD
jgi:hypothetical protein